jgi:hypothetical protein
VKRQNRTEPIKYFYQENSNFKLDTRSGFRANTAKTTKESGNMNDKKLYLKFVDAKVEGIISLYWDNAPETTKAIWGALEKPIRWQTTHAIFSGPEIMMGLPEENRNFDPTKLPPENQTVLPEPGELLWFYQPKNFFKIDPTEFWEIGMFYDVGGRTFGPTGWISCTYFGRMTENLENVAKQCRLIRTEGAKTVELGRLN